MAKKRKEKNWKKFTKVSIVITTLAALVTIISYFVKSKEEPPEINIENGNGIIVNENNGNINYIENKNDKNNNIELIDEELLDLSYAGIYPTSEEGMIIIEDESIYYKKGVVINTEFNNESINSKIITNINFIIDDMDELNACEVDFIPIDWEDGISIYAINNGNSDIENYCIELETTFNNIWDGNTENINYETTNSLILELSHGEIKEIHKYLYSELSEIFNDNEGWLHVFVTDSSNEIINFEPFVCNIVNDKLGFHSIINQGGDGTPDNIMPIFIDGTTSQIEVLNKHQEIRNNGVTGIQFLILPNKSMNV